MAAVLRTSLAVGRYARKGSSAKLCINGTPSLGISDHYKKQSLGCNYLSSLSAINILSKYPWYKSSYSTIKPIHTTSQLQEEIIEYSLFEDVEIPNVSFTEFAFDMIKNYGDKICAVNAETKKSFTFREVYNLTQKVGSGLIRKGFKRGDTLCIYSTNQPEYIITLFAVIAIGGKVTTANPSYTVDELKRQLEVSGSEYIVCSADSAAKAAQAVSQLSAIKSIYVFGETEGCTPFSVLTEDDGMAFQMVTDFDPNEEIAFLPFSSGTTGLPKGVKLTHRNIVANLCQMNKKYISIALFEIVLVVAMVLGVIAEHSLPLSMAPVLIGLSKKLAKDSKALTKLSLDRTTAAYKLRFGLADTMLARTIENIKQVPFSLNMDESTSKNLLRVFTILVSYYSDSSHEVVVEHLASVSLIKVASAPLFEQITGLFDKYNLPWENLMSVLMDSCNVMRGSKTGLEVRLREKASHLLDIDGDSCHHIHNCSKKFCEPFEKAVEKLHTDIYNDFKWSADLMDALKEICMILEVKFTKPDRFLGHRWLSCYDVTLANLRLMDAYLMFYYSFIPKESKPLYHHVVVSIFHSKEASNQSRMRIRVIQEELSRKSLTEDGRKRKNRIVEKLFYKRKQIITILHFYSAVLAMLKQYVCLFELKKPMIHKLYDRQAELFQEFLGLFIKPEELEHKTLKQLKEMDIDKADLLSKKSMFIGFSTEKALQQLDEISAGQFLTKAQTAFKACAGYMQKKLPLTNATLRRLSAIDPTAVGHSLTLLHLKKLPKTFPTVLNMSERQSYDREVHAFQLDCNLPPAYHLDETPVQLDHWWRDVIKMGKYPALTKMAKAIMSCFHGPLVESSFNLMQDILDTRSGRMKIETFNAFQTVKYSITAQKKSSLELFDRQDILRDPVNTTLCNNLQESWKRYKEEKENKRKVIEQKKAAYALKAAKLESKQKSKVAQQLVEKKARMAFIQKRQNNLKRKANLEALVANKKAKRTHPDVLKLGKDDVCMGVLPFYHIFGLVLIALHSVICGSTVVTVSHFEPHVFLKAIEEYKVTLLPLVPYLTVFLTQSPLVAEYELDSLGTIISGASALSDEQSEALISRLPNINLRQGYGMTETSPVCHMAPVNDPKPGSVGVLLPNTECKIIDLETMESVDVNELGEMYIRGPQVMKGYLNNDQATKETIDEDGWLLSGDVGYRDEEGHFYIVDRKKDMIKYRGFQVSPTELEGVLLMHKGVQDCGVIGMPDPQSGELTVAFIVRKEDATNLTVEEITEYIADQVAPHKQLTGGVRLKRKRNKSRKYGLISANNDASLEMEPLDNSDNDDEDEDTTLFDVKNHRRHR
ncbi:Luciferin 4-monooxygenase [Nymphon striatum]|nr:Luciferin 4-monooxygenase [Nymphon striatum]